MAKVTWTQRSLTDLKSIAEFISKDSVKYASLTLQRIIGATSYLENYPKIGRWVPEVGKNHNIREIIFGNFRIIYKNFKFSDCSYPDCSPLCKKVQANSPKEKKVKP